MGRQATTKESIKKQTVKKMRELGVYKAEFDDVIDIYSGLCSEYRNLEAEFAKKGSIYTSKTNSGDLKKHPIVSSMENLRKDILMYSDRLNLNPKAFFKTKPTDNGKNESKLEKALRKYG